MTTQLVMDGSGVNGFINLKNTVIGMENLTFCQKSLGAL